MSVHAAPSWADVIGECAAEPARCAKEYGAVACCCSFCGLQLTDEGSIEVGYGPICAARYGLPHEAKRGKALKPVPVPAEPAKEETGMFIVMTADGSVSPASVRRRLVRSTRSSPRSEAANSAVNSARRKGSSAAGRVQASGTKLSMAGIVMTRR